MKPLVAATGNQGKLRELQALLEPLGFSLSMFAGEIEESGMTYEENALIKARFAVSRTGIAALADDSGLETDALDGAPGLYSARFAAPGDHCTKLLQVMTGKENRKARFISCVALVYPDGRELTATGICEGEITDAPRGEDGFGYDPIFYLPEYGRTFAEIPAELKNKISHRALALRNMINRLRADS